MNAPLTRPLVFHRPGDNEIARRLRGAVQGQVLFEVAAGGGWRVVLMTQGHGPAKRLSEIFRGADLGVRSVEPEDLGAIAAVLARVFPDEARRRAAVAEESSLSRLYASIHYRFDMDAGLALGRAVAAKALAADLDEMAVQ